MNEASLRQASLRHKSGAVLRAAFLLALFLLSPAAAFAGVGDRARELQLFLSACFQQTYSRDEFDCVGGTSRCANIYAQVLQWQREWSVEADDASQSDDEWIDSRLLLLRLGEVRARIERSLELWSSPALFLPLPEQLGKDADLAGRVHASLEALTLADDILLCCTGEKREEFAARGEAVIDALLERSRAGAPDAEEMNLIAALLKGISGFVDRVDALTVDEARAQAVLKREAFLRSLKHVHGLDMTPEQIMDFGRRELARAQRDLQDLADVLEPGMAWREVNERLKDDIPEDLVKTYSEYSDDVIRFIYDQKLFIHYKETDNFRVRWGNPNGADNYPFGFYRQPGKPGGPGSFVVVPVPEDWPEERKQERLRDSCRAFLQVVAPHEGIPGHHYQFSVALMQKHSQLRSSYYTPVYSEGWGLYCEHLLNEYGYFDLRGQFCQIRMRAWRCARAVVDPALHLGLMTQEEAVQYLIDNVGFGRATAESEVNRFLTSPTQPMSYLVGCTAIQSLREEYREKKGRDFDIAEFHDRFLRLGSIPIALARAVLLERRPGKK